MGAPVGGTTSELPPPPSLLFCARRRKYHIIPAMTIINAPPRPTPTPIPTFACGCKPPGSLLEFADDSAVEVAVDEDKDDIDVGDADEEGEEVAVVPSSSVMLK